MNISICTFNIAHGCGSVDSNWAGGALRKRDERLRQIAGLIRLYDLVVLQEVDRYAPWTYFMRDQFKELKRRAGFSHGMFLANRRICPHAGIAILSRFPLVDREVVSLPQFLRVEGLFGYHKHALACTVQCGQQFRLVGVHLDCRGRVVTVPAAHALLSYASEQELPIVLAGDFNSSPQHFPNSWDDQLTALDILKDSGRFQVFPEDPMLSDMTFPVGHDRCVLDWILLPNGYQCLEYKVIDVALSDHRPVAARVSIPE